MKLRIIRNPVKGKPTMGELWIDGVFFCYTLEDEDRGLEQAMPLGKIKELKVYGDTAIPYGRYAVRLTNSVKFNRLLPLIVNVNGFDGVRIHRGNFKKDTLGCPLVGFEKGDFAVLDSRRAEIELIRRLKGSGDKVHELVIERVLS